MSREFLDHLLSTTENRVQSHGDTTCMICLEKYSTLNIETGTLEIEIRLPCGHGVGSSCIVTWLKTNDSCPACRAILFSAQSRPYLEHGIMNAEISNAEIPEHSTGSIERNINTYIRILCHNLGQTEVSKTVACSMAKSVASSWATIRNLSSPRVQRCVATASLYMASHVIRQPVTLQLLDRVLGVGEENILAICSHTYPSRMRLIDVQTLEPLVGGHIEGMLAFLPSPDHGFEIINNEEMRRVLRNDRPWQEAIDICVRHATEMGGPMAEVIAKSIAGMILRESHLGFRAQSIVVVIAFFMASHLLGSGASLQRIGELVNIDERSLAMAYAYVFPLRNQLIKPRTITRIGMENLPRAIEALPALSWPPLEV